MLRLGHELRGALWRGLFLTLVLELMLVPAVLYWPEFELHVGKLKSMTPLPVLKQLVGRLESGGVFAYVAGQHFFKGCNVLGAVAAVLFAMGAVAGEAHRGTLEILLARPVSRVRLIAERWLMGALALCLPVVLTTLTIPPLLAAIDIDARLAPYLWSALHQCTFLLGIYSATFLWSCLGRRPMVIAMGMLFLTILQFAIYLVERMTHWSLIRLADIEVLMRIQGRLALDARLVGGMLAFSAVCFGLSVLAFQRRVP
ncbi:MAG TPA: ABC transporter permease subunit [Planctomycetota bacterium]|nr:ABC transporter permease subunit [Planctomycetota bacterium]